jgi:hypothetical protein
MLYLLTKSQDIITYKIEKLTPFVVSESVKGDGKNTHNLRQVPC